MSVRRIDLRVETLVLDGFPADSRAAIVAGLRAALARALATADPASLQSIADEAVLDAGVFAARPSMSPERLGAAAGSAVARVLR